MEVDSHSWVKSRTGLLLAVLLLSQECYAHIRLTFPPARKYQFDFLDNVRTPGPCGMPSGLGGERTSLEAGSRLDIHWHLSYPHKGGYFFQIRDASGGVKARYPPTSGFLGTQDGTSLNYSVPLPSEECRDCTFRMLRQAREWGNTYLFWSCADIDILSAVPDSDKCSGHGTVVNRACSCNKFYTGDRCQFKNECDIDRDCGANGICVNTEATSYPKQQCYCTQGWFGSRCQHKSSVTSKPTPSDLKLYSSRTLSTGSDVKVYYRVVQDEVEVIMRARTSTWMGFGWRQSSTKKTCQNFPDLGNSAYNMGDAQGEAESEAEYKSEGEPTAEGEAKAEGHPEAEAEYKGNSTAEAEAESHGNSTAETESHGNPTAEAEAESHGNSTAEAEAESHGNSTAEAEAESHGNSTAEAEAEHGNSTAEAESEHHGHSAAEAEDKVEGSAEGEATSEGHDASAEGSAEAEAEGEAESEYSSGLHPMDCTDIVIGSAKGSYSRIGDYYTRDRSTPVRDEYLGGSNSLTAGLVWEEQDYTVMLFRKKLIATDSTDHSLDNELTHVLWAIGQQRNANDQYNHYPKSALETPNVSIPDFYKEDELKYHGHQGQRGAAAFNFYLSDQKQPDDEEDCTRGSCTAKECGMDLSWTYDASTDLITFNISAKYVRPDQWIGLGFSEDASMPESDVIYGGMDPSGQAFVEDGYLTAYKAPAVDQQQDVKLVSGGHTDSRTTLVFTRPRSTRDSKDVDLSQCRYLFVAGKGGAIKAADGFKGRITKHASTPTVSQVCFGVCQSKVKYATQVTARLPAVQYKESFRDPASDDFKLVANTLKEAFENRLRPILGRKLLKVDILALRSGSIVVDFEVQTQTAVSVTEDAVGQEVKEAVNSLNEQTIENYGALQLQQVSDTYRVDGSVDKHTHTKLLTEVEIIIIAVVLALVLVAVIIGICKCLEIRRAKRNDKQRAMTRETSSTSSGTGESKMKKDTMTYGQFMATSAAGSGDSTVKRISDPSPYPAFGNPGYDSAGYKIVP